MKNFLIITLLFLCIAAARAEEKQLASPDGKLTVTVSDENGQPSYRIDYNGVCFLKSSPLGLITNIGDFSRQMTLKPDAQLGRITETYSLPTIKQSTVNYTATEGVYSFVQQDRTVFDIIFRVSNRDVAFKYRVYPRKETLCCIVKQETTGFVFPDGTTTFLCPQSKPMGGFARTSPSYETSYKADDAVGQNGWKHQLR